MSKNIMFSEEFYKDTRFVTIYKQIPAKKKEIN
jgi:hypothetical protein